MSAAQGMWRFADRLPIQDPSTVVSLGEGDTPVIDLSATLGRELGVGRLVVKAEDRNPTGSFKARIASVAASIVRERGLGGLVGTSSGNGGAAAAAYAAAAGSRAVLFTLSDTAEMKLREITAMGALAYRVRGVGHDAASTRAVADLIAQAAQASGWYPMLTGYHYAPEAMRGVETIAWELAEQEPGLTAVYAPVGGGGLLTGIARGFAALGGRAPRLIGVHPTGASALPRALAGHPEGMAEPVSSTVSGLQMPVLYDAEGAPSAVRSTGGHAAGVDDDAIWAAQARLAREFGLLVEPAGAAALAGVLADADAGRLHPADRVAVIATGAGYKDVLALERLSSAEPPRELSPDAVQGVLEALGEAVDG